MRGERASACHSSSGTYPCYKKSYKRAPRSYQLYPHPRRSRRAWEDQPSLCLVLPNGLEMKSHWLPPVHNQKRPSTHVRSRPNVRVPHLPRAYIHVGEFSIQSQPCGRLTWSSWAEVTDNSTAMQAYMKQDIRVNSRRWCARVFRDGLGCGGACMGVCRSRREEERPRLRHASRGSFRVRIGSCSAPSSRRLAICTPS
jgi:hypothetical protein